MKNILFRKQMHPDAVVFKRVFKGINLSGGITKDVIRSVKLINGTDVLIIERLILSNNEIKDNGCNLLKVFKGKYLYKSKLEILSETAFLYIKSIMNDFDLLGINSECNFKLTCKCRDGNC